MQKYSLVKKHIAIFALMIMFPSFGVSAFGAVEGDEYVCTNDVDAELEWIKEAGDHFVVCVVDVPVHRVGVAGQGAGGKLCAHGA